jgi:uncharacterized protein YndB with AHSA1/START domain
MMTKQQQQLEVVIKGPLEKVFDLVTVAGLWPQWIPRAFRRIREMDLKSERQV